MNIWYFHHYATPYEIPGLHRPFEFGSHFKKQGHNMAVFTSSYLHYSGENMICGHEKHLLKTYDGVDSVFVRTCGYGDSKAKRIANMLQFGKRLSSSAKWYAKNHWKPDIIIASSPHPLTLLAGIKIAKQLHIPCVCEVRDLWPEVFFMGGLFRENSFIGKMFLRGERYIYEKADSLLFLKEGDHTYISDHHWDVGHGGKIPMERCKYVNNGVDLKLFAERLRTCQIEKENMPNPQKFNVVYCGTIRTVNNIDMLLDVAKLVPQDIQFLIYGTGNCVSDLEQRIRNENIKNVSLMGYVENKFIPSVLSNASINILNYSGTKYNWSRGNSSNKLFEYLASGKPVVSTVRMGYDILKKYQCGISAEECTPHQIANAIQKIYELPVAEYEAMCENAEKAAKEFDIPVLANKYMNILHEIIENYMCEEKKDD